MNRINSILNSNKFKKYLNKNVKLEETREFCKHDLRHFLDVARIAYIITLEQNMNLSKDVVYATALLHDIGRWKQYENNIPHNEASYELARDILCECLYNENEQQIILNAILNHRNKLNKKGTFDEIFYVSDKLSRECFNCHVNNKCNWSKEKKNYRISY